MKMNDRNMQGLCVLKVKTELTEWLITTDPSRAREDSLGRKFDGPYSDFCSIMRKPYLLSSRL